MRVHLGWSRFCFVAATLAAAAAGGFLAVRTSGQAAGEEPVRQPPTAHSPANADDTKAIQKVQAAYVKAFNAGDAKALAAFWSVDGEFVDDEGKTFRGRSAIEKEFAAFFAETKGPTLAISTDSLRFVSPGVALETGTARVARGSDDDASTTSFSIVHIKKDGQWQLASVRETPYVPASNYDQLRDLEWLVGSWTAQSGGRTLEQTCEWTAKRNFLTRKYTVKDAEGSTRTGIQIIGWDPMLGVVRSWVFDSDGGFGSERWTRDGQRWILEANSVTRDGAEVTATNILNRIDHDHFTWQSVRRDLNQVRLPDTAVIQVTRVKSTK